MWSQVLGCEVTPEEVERCMSIAADNGVPEGLTDSQRSWFEGEFREQTGQEWDVVEQRAKTYVEFDRDWWSTYLGVAQPNTLARGNSHLTHVHHHSRVTTSRVFSLTSPRGLDAKQMEAQESLARRRRQDLRRMRRYFGPGAPLVIRAEGVLCSAHNQLAEMLKPENAQLDDGDFDTRCASATEALKNARRVRGLACHLALLAKAATKRERRRQHQALMVRSQRFSRQRPELNALDPGCGETTRRRLEQLEEEQFVVSALTEGEAE
jgi:hypothetical protein